MKNKIIKIIFAILLLYVSFITEESSRLKNNINSKPLIVLKEDSIDEYRTTYYSLGFKLKKEFYIDKKSHDDIAFKKVVGEEFYLFYKIMLWGWIE